MKIIKCEKPTDIDVDDTLIHEVDSDYPGCIKVDYYGMERYIVPNNRHIELLKACHARGEWITVHSGNGWRWVETIIKTLKLQKYVNVCKTKSVKYVDDKPYDSFTQRIYLGAVDGIKTRS